MTSIDSFLISFSDLYPRIKVKLDTLQPHQFRVVEEWVELCSKLNKLHDFLTDKPPAYSKVSSVELELLKEQLNAMLTYEKILATRINLYL
jgi:hypothetical protein